MSSNIDNFSPSFYLFSTNTRESLPADSSCGTRPHKQAGFRKPNSEDIKHLFWDAGSGMMQRRKDNGNALKEGYV